MDARASTKELLELPGERYCYGGAGVRLGKSSPDHRVRYLPGLEWRMAGRARWQVVAVRAGARAACCVRWCAGRPRQAESSQTRHRLGDHQDSATLEIDEQARVLNREVFYPFGGTALWCAAHQVEVKLKSCRHAAQERDASGLDAYAFRYYAGWLGRWISADPAGPVDGLNLFAMVGNNPVTQRDPLGLADESDPLDLVLAGLALGAFMWATARLLWRFCRTTQTLTEPRACDIEALGRCLMDTARLDNIADQQRYARRIGAYLDAFHDAYEHAGMTRQAKYHGPRHDWRMVVHRPERIVDLRMRTPVGARAEIEAAAQGGDYQYLVARILLTPNAEVVRYAITPLREGGEHPLAGAHWGGQVRLTEEAPQASARPGRTRGAATASAAPPTAGPSRGGASAARGVAWETEVTFGPTYLRQAGGFDEHQREIATRVLGNLTDAGWRRRHSHAVGGLRSTALPNWTRTGGGLGAWRMLFSEQGRTINIERIENYHEGKKKRFKT
ncbi:RHS repeat-associated core domain-containing protein [Pandoraea sp.]|uniref:RHS repeat-associated core domain-containing protein n=1 Tax=Pandoraea sp. TaxID=1883445 RepID=UPI00121B6333|nr:RHS repeat-associated core domain-containing protein [Pandoraea sp.]TAL53386.1 MAG: RHS repeat-associated core domain-containing protein [Pandoraea sp.]TAM20476.1 MAG: RHS repeat-associated core domain-containing protein [Pandoraea sp.]